MPILTSLGAANKRVRFARARALSDTDAAKAEANKKVLLQRRKCEVEIWTDGSVTPGIRSGASAVVLQKGKDPMTLTASVSQWACSLTAEMRGMLLALEHAFTIPQRYIRICTDSLSLVMCLRRGPRSTDERIQHIWSCLLRLVGLGKRIWICFVYAHCGTVGNELADAAADDASRRVHAGGSHWKDATNLAIRDIEANWRASCRDTHRSLLLGSHAPTPKVALNLPRPVGVPLARVRTGETRLLGRFPRRLGILKSDNCRLCCPVDEVEPVRIRAILSDLRCPDCRLPKATRDSLDKHLRSVHNYSSERAAALLGIKRRSPAVVIADTPAPPPAAAAVVQPLPPLVQPQQQAPGDEVDLQPPPATAARPVFACHFEGCGSVYTVKQNLDKHLQNVHKMSADEVAVLLKINRHRKPTAPGEAPAPRPARPTVPTLETPAPLPDEPAAPPLRCPVAIPGTGSRCPHVAKEWHHLVSHVQSIHHPADDAILYGALRGNMEALMRSKSKPPDSYSSCTLCSYITPSPSALSKHMRLAHNVSKRERGAPATGVDAEGPHHGSRDAVVETVAHLLGECTGTRDIPMSHDRAAAFDVRLLAVVSYIERRIPSSHRVPPQVQPVALEQPNPPISRKRTLRVESADEIAAQRSQPQQQPPEPPPEPPPVPRPLPPLPPLITHRRPKPRFIRSTKQKPRPIAEPVVILPPEAQPVEHPPPQMLPQTVEPPPVIEQPADEPKPPPRKPQLKIKFRCVRHTAAPAVLLRKVVAAAVKQLLHKSKRKPAKASRRQLGVLQEQAIMAEAGLLRPKRRTRRGGASRKLFKRYCKNEPSDSHDKPPKIDAAVAEKPEENEQLIESDDERRSAEEQESTASHTQRNIPVADATLGGGPGPPDQNTESSEPTPVPLAEVGSGEERAPSSTSSAILVPATRTVLRLGLQLLDLVRHHATHRVAEAICGVVESVGRACTAALKKAKKRMRDWAEEIR